MFDGHAIAAGTAEIASTSLTDHFEERLKNSSEEKKGFEGVRKELSEIVAKFSNRFKLLYPDEEKYPLVFIIDELDRCRPDFAIGILEKIKHFYSVPEIFS